MARRPSYPMQSCPMQTTQQPQAPSANEHHTPELPKYIRAVESAEKFKLQGRTLIICLDGTGDKFDSDNSNIVHLVSCLKKDDPSQVTYYQSGIGTYGSGGLSNGVAAAVDMAIGSGLGVHIRDAYRFLMQTYREGDKICLFGFSRGAYTARCLAGMLHKVGLLPAHNRAQIAFAYKFYKDDTLEGWKMSYEFKRAFCIDISVHFIGVFDSVASVGLIPRKLPLSSTPSNKPVYFRHAMGLDEHRSKFKVCRYQQRDHIDPDSHWRTIAEMHERSTPLWQRRKSTKTRDSISTGSSYTIKDEKDSGLMSDVPEKKVVGAREVDCLEVWFSGCHADVGGGAVKNEVRHKLSQIPLRWMIRQCFECNTGILFDSHRLAEEGLDVHTLSPVYFKPRKPTIGPSPQTMEKYENGAIAPISRRATVLKAVDENDKDGLYSVDLWQDHSRQTPADHWIPEQIEDYFDAISPINDQLVEARGWWVLEFWPIKVKIQPKDTDAWVKKVGFNLGRFRPIQDTEPNLHWTAHQRMQDKEQAYKVRARLDRNATWRVVV